MALIGYENAIEVASTLLAASSEADGLSAAQLRVPQGSPAVAWQTAAGVTTASLTITAAAAVAWRAVALCRTNLTPAATLRVRLGTAAGVVSSPVYDSGTISAAVAFGLRQGLHVLPAATSAVCMRLDLADPTNPDGFLNIPLVYAGPCAITPILPGSDFGFDARRGDTVTRGGAVITDALSLGRGWQLRLSARDDDIPWLDALEAAAAAGINVLFVPRVGYSRASSESVFGLLQSGRRGFVGATGAWRTWSGTISERL